MSNSNSTSGISTRCFIVFSLHWLLLWEMRFTEVNSYSTALYEHGVSTKQVVILTKETFQKAISSDPANSFWFLKFFAPWYVYLFIHLPHLRVCSAHSNIYEPSLSTC